MDRIGAGLLAFALLFLLQPYDAAHARGGGMGGGMGGHAMHAGGHFRAHHGRSHFARHNQNQWLWYGGYYTLPPDVSTAGNVTSSVPVMYVPVRVAGCHKVQEAMTVPSEEGGTRQVTVTRCQ
jgi:hypothetical protein